MPVSWAAKDPSEVRNYSYSWLGRLNGAEIDTATFTLVPRTSTVNISNVAFTANSISATISGGQDCEFAQFLSTVTTTGGETLEEAITLIIANSLFLNAGPSTSTKRQIVEMAYEECALAGYEFNVTPEELFTGLRRLDAMMAQWTAEGMGLNYNAPATFGGGDLEDYTGIPDAAITGVAITLAKAIAPYMGKAMSAESRSRLASAMDTIRAVTAAANMKTVPYKYGTIRGAGQKIWNYPSPFLRRNTTDNSGNSG